MVLSLEYILLNLTVVLSLEYILLNLTVVLSLETVHFTESYSGIIIIAVPDQGQKEKRK